MVFLHRVLDVLYSFYIHCIVKLTKIIKQKQRVKQKNVIIFYSYQASGSAKLAENRGSHKKNMAF